jgi:uncharacterized protein (DUF2235 family)
MGLLNWHIHNPIILLLVGRGSVFSLRDPQFRGMIVKSIVLCADGTWNTPHADAPSKPDTNVRKLCCALLDTPEQLKYYDSGVGTDGTPLDHLSGGRAHLSRREHR